MPETPFFPPIEGGFIQGVALVDQLTRPMASTFVASSLPGHLIQYVVAGEVEQDAAGRRQRLTPGSVVWYHENEVVEGRILKTPWVFYTVNFSAVRLPPPPFDCRVWKPGANVQGQFQSLLDVWRAASQPPMLRHIRALASLLDILATLVPHGGENCRVDTDTHLWWDIESQLREDLGRPIDLDLLQSLAIRSRQAVVKACRAAVGVSPMKRVKEIRLSYARGLVLHSRLTMTEIAMRVGYGRSQEFSRDYHRAFGRTPSEDRRRGPDYREIQICE
jgi:AraC-like DNA-binding protein